MGLRNVALLALIAACDPGFTMQGDVLDGSRRPLPGARVVLVCSGVDQSWTETDSQGHFHFMHTGVFGSGCTVEVRKPGYKTASFDVLASCTSLYRKGSCEEVTLHATLH
jgi:hypothetical protein